VINQDISMCVTIRLASGQQDIEAMAAIDDESFDDWWRPEVIAYSIGRQDTTGIVATWHGEIVGFAIYAMRGEGPASCIEVKRLAVAEHARRCGIGGILLDDIIGRLTLIRQAVIFPVRESNLEAQLWLKEYGFICRAIEPLRFTGEEDAYMFCWDRIEDKPF